MKKNHTEADTIAVLIHAHCQVHHTDGVVVDLQSVQSVTGASRLLMCTTSGRTVRPRFD